MKPKRWRRSLGLISSTVRLFFSCPLNHCLRFTLYFLVGAWLVFLIVASSIAHTRGNSRVWVGPVTGTEFFAPAGKTEQSSEAVQYAPASQQQVPQGYAAQQGYPQMQQQYTGGPVPQQYTGGHAPQQPSYPPSNAYNPQAQP